MMQDIKSEIKRLAREMGFDLCRVATVPLPAHYHERLTDWVADGKHGSMSWMAERLQKNIQLDDLLPQTRSMIMFGVNYWRADDAPDADKGQISRYAVTRDYHKIIRQRLKKLAAEIEALESCTTRVFVDTGPVLERAFAEQAGLGYIGKNTMLISQEFGSWIFLACILTDLDLSPDQGESSIRCGSCRKCIDDCPTDAILEDGSLDARRCISYLTIENKDGIPEELRPLMGNWIFGCDICQEVCPHNNRKTITKDAEFADSRFPDRSLDLAELLGIKTDEDFLARFAGTPLMRAKRRGLLRNACVAAGNSGNADLLPLLQDIIQDEADAMLSEHAQWAADQIKTRL